MIQPKVGKGRLMGKTLRMASPIFFLLASTSKAQGDSALIGGDIWAKIQAVRRRIAL